MDIGIPREIKEGERRVALTPAAVRSLVGAGHMVCVQAGAGNGAGFGDAEYAAAGARLVESADQAFAADLVVKVKEIQANEWRHLRPGGMVFSFLHLGADALMTRELLNRRVTGIAFETVQDAAGRLPILAPMSVIAGEMSIPIAANLLLASNGGKGVLLRDARVLVVGAGNAGIAAARTAHALGASVCVMARRERPPALADGIAYAKALGDTVVLRAREADVIVGAVNVRGELTPKLLTRADLRAIPEKSVLIDICIDGGGIAETSRQTYHAAPSYVEESIIHYCVANMPAAVPRSATLAISNAVLPYVQKLADHGLLSAIRADDGFAHGLQMHGGAITQHALAAALNETCLDMDAVLFHC
jgi:alanine dehydrogenase